MAVSSRTHADFELAESGDACATTELPVHAMQAICERLPAADVQSIRLACKAWRDAASACVHSLSVQLHDPTARSENEPAAATTAASAVAPLLHATAAYPACKQLQLAFPPGLLLAMLSDPGDSGNTIQFGATSLDMGLLLRHQVAAQLLEAFAGSPSASSGGSRPASRGNALMPQLPRVLYVDAPALPRPEPDRASPEHDLQQQQLLLGIFAPDPDGLQVLDVGMQQQQQHRQASSEALQALCALLGDVYTATGAALAGSGSSSLAAGTAGKSSGGDTASLVRQQQRAAHRLVLHTGLRPGSGSSSSWALLAQLRQLHTLILSSNSITGCNDSSSSSSVNCSNDLDALLGGELRGLRAAAGQLRGLVCAVTGVSPSLLVLGGLTNLTALHLHGVGVNHRWVSGGISRLRHLQSLHLSGDLQLRNPVRMLSSCSDLTSLHLQQPLLVPPGQLQQLPQGQQQEPLRQLLQQLPRLQRLGLMDWGPGRQTIQFTGEPRADELLWLQQRLYRVLTENDADNVIIDDVIAGGGGGQQQQQQQQAPAGEEQAAAAAQQAAEGQEGEDEEEEDDMLDDDLEISEGLAVPMRVAARALAQALTSGRMGNNAASLLEQQLLSGGSSSRPQVFSFLTPLPLPAAAAAAADTSPSSSSSHLDTLAQQQQQQQEAATAPGEPPDALSGSSDGSGWQQRRLALVSVSTGAMADVSQILQQARPVSLELASLPSLVQVLHMLYWPTALRPGFNSFFLQLSLLPRQPLLSARPAAGQLLASLSISTAASAGGLVLDDHLIAVIAGSCPNLQRLQLEGVLLLPSADAGSSSSANALAAAVRRWLRPAPAADGPFSDARFPKLEQLVLADTRQQALRHVGEVAAGLVPLPLLVHLPPPVRPALWWLLRLSVYAATGAATQLIDHFMHSHKPSRLGWTCVFAGLHLLFALKVENQQGSWFLVAEEQQQLLHLYKQMRWLVADQPRLQLCGLPRRLRLLELSGVGLVQHRAGSSSCRCNTGSNTTTSSSSSRSGGQWQQEGEQQQLLEVKVCSAGCGDGAAGDSVTVKGKMPCRAQSLQAVVLQRSGHPGSSSSSGRLHEALGSSVLAAAPSAVCFSGAPGAADNSSSSASGVARPWQHQAAAAAQQAMRARLWQLSNTAAEASVHLLRRLLALQKQLHGLRLAGVLAGGLLVQLLVAHRAGSLCDASCCWELRVLHKGAGLLGSVGSAAARCMVAAAKSSSGGSGGGGSSRKG